MADPYQNTPDGSDVSGASVQQYANALQGVTPRAHTFKNDDDNFALVIQNTDSTDGGNHLKVLASDGVTVLVEVTDAGVSFGTPTPGNNLHVVGTLTVDGASTVANLSATTLAASSTLNVTGLATLTGGAALGGPLTIPGPSGGTGGFYIYEGPGTSRPWGLERVYTPEQFGAYRDGNALATTGHDDYSALQAAITAAAGGGVVQLSNGYYNCSTKLNCTNINGLTIRGPGIHANSGVSRCKINFTSAINDGACHLLDFANSNNITLEGFTIDGNAVTRAGTGLFFAPATGVTEGGSNICLRRLIVSGPYSTTAVYLWSTLYARIENCGLFTNAGSNYAGGNNNSCLSISTVNYAGLYSPYTQVMNGNAGLTGATSGAGSYADGARHTVVEGCLIFNQINGSGNAAIHLDGAHQTTITASEPANVTSDPSIVIQDTVLTDHRNITRDLEIVNCQVSGLHGPVVAIASASPVKNLKLTGCYSGNLDTASGGWIQGTVSDVTLDGLYFKGNYALYTLSPGFAVKLVTASTGIVQIDNSEIHADGLLVSVSGRIEHTVIYKAGTVTAVSAGDLSTRL